MLGDSGIIDGKGYAAGLSQFLSLLNEGFQKMLIEEQIIAVDKHLSFFRFDIVQGIDITLPIGIGSQ